MTSFVGHLVNEVNVKWTCAVTRLLAISIEFAFAYSLGNILPTAYNFSVYITHVLTISVLVLVDPSNGRQTEAAVWLCLSALIICVWMYVCMVVWLCVYGGSRTGQQSGRHVLRLTNELMITNSGIVMTS